MYFTKLAYQLKKRKSRSLDDLVLQRVDLRHRKEPHDTAIWKSMLEAEFGPQAVIDYYAMSMPSP
jgi:hypothetical protein